MARLESGFICKTARASVLSIVNIYNIQSVSRRFTYDSIIVFLMKTLSFEILVFKFQYDY